MAGQASYGRCRSGQQITDAFFDVGGQYRRNFNCHAGGQDPRRHLRDEDSWVLNGTEAWITNAGVSESHTVIGRRVRECR
jgi:hypothetical protein